MNEKKAIEYLKSLLKTAEKYNFPIERMLVCDGFLKALNITSGKDYGFSGTKIYIMDDYGHITEYV